MATDARDDVEEGRESNGGGGGVKQEHRSARRRSPVAAMIEDFPPVWFAICMNSGILSILTHQLPYQFSGLHIISAIFYCIDLVLFILFTAIFVARLIIYPSAVLKQVGSDFEQLAFLALWPIAWLTLCTTTALVVSQASWGAYAFTIVSYAMWWFGAVWTFATSVAVYYTLFKRSMITPETISPAIIIPAVGVATVASTGGLIANYAFDIGPRLQVPVIIVGYVLLGQGIFLALMVYAFFIQRLLTSGFPPAAKLPGLILLMGPTGQCATALQILGSCAHGGGAFAGYHQGTFLQSSAAAGLDASSIMLSMLLFGFGVFLLCIALCALVEAGCRRELRWSMAWWSTIFPMGTMNSATLIYATEMDSPAWRVVTAGLLVVLVVDYLLCWVYTIYHVLYGELLIPKDARRSLDKEK